jgi:NadR type nicotinamide-nucleotide adenylyltransferase
MVAIVITGPESTGKSVLTNALAKHFGGLLVEEYARQYVESIDGRYTFEDVEEIGRVQIREYDQMIRNAGKNELVFFDTFLIITKVWFQEVFSCCPLWLHRAIEERKVAIALLCAPDIPWKEDGVRENPHKRDYLFDCYKRELEYYKIPFARVEGQGTHRLENAVRQITVQSVIPSFLLQG